MEQVRLNAFSYQGVEYIGIYIEQKLSLITILQQCRHLQWNALNRCWMLNLSRENYALLLKLFTGIANIDIAELRAYLLQKKAVGNNTDAIIGGSNKLIPIPGTNTGGTDRHKGIDPVNWTVLSEMEELLKLKAYSRSTIKTYLNEMVPLLRLLKERPIDQLNEGDIRRYMVYCYEKLKLSENTLHSRINALKFYFEQVLKRERFFWDIPRPKRHMQLPRLLNEDELARLFNSLSNKKHKAMLFTAYSAGLRVSEIVNLRLEDIDSTRMQIFVSKAKGKKDRYVNLSPVLLDILRSYISTYRPAPRLFLFESAQTHTAYPARTVQQIFSNAKLRAGIRKKIGIHSLRHSFATHLLDKGTDIKYIKDLLGHFNIKTTERYLHVSKKQLVNIVSPFDDLFRSGDIDW